ncbi:c-type cytochrome [Sphaerotilus uruguayifluvii]|uniref:Cytochrome c553 n=1 Tax=Sphaerotilus uruguayifluvii TaxID=2735897 RepID=A0ABX2FX58_9BURK|nr:c-type cytochrome [Leptothrix sp. C29]NRT54611.1 cytochrome c553 [Leptothrix sp. C29]
MKSHVKSLLALLAAAVMATPLAASESKPAAKADLVKGEAISAQVCSACHTADGSRGVATNPILQGQHPEYLVKQLTEFKAGKRASAVMNGMAAPLSDEDMKNVAAFYASKEAKPGAAKSQELVALGEKIYRGGIADRKVPACAGCHSPTGAGIPAQYPRLAGQHSDYTELQLKNFRDGIRKNNTVMSGVAAKMNDREIKAVADYVSGLHN